MGRKSDIIELDVISELNAQRRLYRHLIAHGVTHKLAMQISNGYKTETNESWLTKLIDSLLTFTKEN